MDSNNSISSSYLSERANEARGLVRPGRRGQGEFGEIRTICRREPRGRLWHGRVGRDRRRKERRGRGVRRKLLLDLCPRGGEEGRVGSGGM